MSGTEKEPNGLEGVANRVARVAFAGMLACVGARGEVRAIDVAHSALKIRVYKSGLFSAFANDHEIEGQSLRDEWNCLRVRALRCSWTRASSEFWIRRSPTVAGVPIGTVMSRLARARLQQLLAGPVVATASRRSGL